MNKISTTVICFVILLILTAATDAQIQPEQLDPLDLLLTESGEIKRSTTINTIAASEADNIVDTKPAQHYPNAFINYDNNLLWSSPANFASSLELLSQENTADNNNIIIPADHNLIEAQIAVPFTDAKNKTSSTLQQMIERVRSIRFEPTEESSEPVLEEEPTITPETEAFDNNESNPDTAQQQQTPPPKVEQQQASSNDIINKEILNQVELLTEQPEQAKNPLLLAEVLALSGHHKQAAIMYNEALKRLTEGQSLSIHDKAWLLLQTASSQKTYEAKQALKTYADLLEQCQGSGSPWVFVAQAESDVLNWLQAEKPQELIELCKSELNMTDEQILGN
ncbi:MAG: hypothetical protein PVG93_00700 [Phycisphaerales bacterium]|jgi:hypothetical protein